MVKQALAASAPDENTKMRATGFARYAYAYIEAASAVDDTIGRGDEYAIISPMPAYYLAMLGIELTLKAFLLYSNEQRPEKYGHDLHKCLRKAKELGLNDVYKLNEADQKAINLLSDLNKDHGLRYIRKGWKEFPSWAIVEPLAIRLHQAIAPLVGYKTFTVHIGV